MKIVVNKCYGGFGISVQALLELVLLNADCVEKYSPKDYYGGDKHDWENKWEDDFKKYKNIGNGFLSHPGEFNIYKDSVLYSLKSRYENNVRCDKNLVEIVEKLGDMANGRYASLEVIEIPDGIEWEIDEYDGIETIHEKHRSW